MHSKANDKVIHRKWTSVKKGSWSGFAIFLGFLQKRRHVCWICCTNPTFLFPPPPIIDAQRKFKYRRRRVDSVTQCGVKWVLAGLRCAALRRRVGWSQINSLSKHLGWRTTIHNSPQTPPFSPLSCFWLPLRVIVRGAPQKHALLLPKHWF